MSNGEATFSTGMTALMAFLIVVVLIIAFFIRRQIKRAQYGDEYIRWGTSKEKSRQYDDAMKCYMAAEEVYRENGDEAGRARAYYLAGMMESKRENHEEARKYYRKAEPIARESSPPEDLGYLLMNLGETEEELGNEKKAMKYYADAADVYEKAGDNEGLLFAQERLNYEGEGNEDDDEE